MRIKELNARARERMTALVLDTGEEAVAALTRMAKERHWSASQFTGIGAFERVVLGYFDWDTKSYRQIPMNEQMEVLTLAGDISLDPDGAPSVHAHIVLGRRDGTAHGGHLLEGHVRPTLEIILTELPAALVRHHDPESGLSLIRAIRS